MNSTLIYTISHIDGGSISMPLPSKMPEAGDILVFRQENCFGADDIIYDRGDELHLMKRTQQFSTDWRISSIGNWLVISKFGLWVSPDLEWLLATTDLCFDEISRKAHDASK